MAESPEPRRATLLRDAMMLAAAGLALLNGQAWSPLFDPVLFLLQPFMAPLVSHPLVLFYLTTLFISLATLLLAGVPAAIYERARGQGASTPISVGIWLGATIVLSLPTLANWLDAE